ncbi:hypothetical protein AYO40_03325 [Planctomycetaceae bacterium SCGC AG-212-D15]|nr:hypothetical protein AYO40_03325 [Planctomycetaceae bacterium SCGC AG-212-D15]
MRRILLGLVVGLAAIVLPAVQSQSKPAKKAKRSAEKEGAAKRPGPKEDAAKLAADRSADESAIRANVARFVKAYNAGDAKALAALFTSDGQIEDKQGNVSEGQDAIAKTFGELFAETPDRQLEVFVEAIRFIGADLAIETGSTKETTSPNEPPQYDRYTVLHVKRDGKWQMAAARDEEGPVGTPHERLLPLAWLVGEWVDDGGSTVVNSSCRWSKDGNFLLQDFKVKVNGRDTTNISQRIAWDPLAKRIRSWVFDSEGGFGESSWTRDGDGWIIKAAAVRPDGTTASATNRVIPAGRDAYVWRSMDRVVGDEVEPSLEVKVVRKPPQPRD